MFLLSGSDALDFYEGILGKGFYRNGAAGGEGSLEKLGVHLVHGGKICHISKQHRSLYHIIICEPGSLKYCTYILKRTAGLCLNTLRHLTCDGIYG